MMTMNISSLSSSQQIGLRRHGQLNRSASALRTIRSAARSTHWEGFTQRLQLLGAHSSALRNAKAITPEALLKLTSNTHMVSQECKLKSRQNFHDTGFWSSVFLYKSVQWG